VIDFCSLDQVGKNKQLRQYYLSETLLSMPIKKGKSYFDALVQAEVLPKQGDMTACQLTQATKAIFLDKGPAEANAYFN
jgi:hypothetical protein